MSGNSSPLEEKAKNQHPPVDSTKQGDTQIAKAQLTKFPEPKSKPKEREEIKKIIKDDSDEEKEEESEDYTPSDENDVSIEADG